jgi:hypothetical protein
MYGILRRVGESSWEGGLHGYRVYISERGGQWYIERSGQWYVWLCPRGEWTERCLRSN